MVCRLATSDKVPLAPPLAAPKPAGRGLSVNRVPGLPVHPGA